MDYACFISYRHPGNNKTVRIIEAFKDALESRLALHLSGAKAYLDGEKLRIGDLFQSELASALCSSACMVMLYNRSYFDLNHHFCAREYQAMLRLERERLAKLSANQQGKGLVLTLALRDPGSVPAEIAEDRHYFDVSKLTLAPRSFDDKSWLKKLDEIAEVVADRYYALQSVTLPGQDCSSFKLPPFGEIEDWLSNLVQNQRSPRMPGH